MGLQLWRGRHNWRRNVAFAAAAASAAACSLLVPLNEQQCSVNGDCASRGGEFVGAVCLDQVCVKPAPVVDASTDSDAPVDAGLTYDANDPWACLDFPPEVTNASQVVITLNVFDALKSITTAGAQGGSDFTVLAYDPVPGISVEACGLLDPTCGTPIAAPEVTDDAGEVTFDVEDDFSGFFQFNAANYLPSKLYPGNLQADAATFAPPAAILGTQETALLAYAIGVPMQTDPEAGVGHAFFQVYDCFDRHAAGVAFTLAVDAGSDTVQWYTQNNLPSTTSKETDSLGAGGEVNVPEGAVTVTATLVASNRVIGSINTVISAGGTTFAWLRPRTH